MKYLKHISTPQNGPKAASLPFTKTCLMSGGSLTNGGDTYSFDSDGV